MTDVGFVTGPVGGFAEPQDTNLSEVPTSNWEAGGDWFEGIKRLGRATQRGQMEQDLSPIPEPPQTGGGFLDTPGNMGTSFGGQGDPGQDSTFGTQAQIQQRQNDTLTKDDANSQFGIEGELAFDGPVLKGVAQNLYEAKRDELMRRSIAERAPPGFFNGLGRFGANFVKQFFDPLNVAASFIPVVGEARYAEWLAEAGSAAARAGIRAGVGTAAGAVGQIPLSGLQYALSKSEQQDYSAVQALTDIATGALIGGVLHVGGGFVKDRITGEYRPATPTEARTTAEPLTLPQAIHETPKPTQETALRSAIAAVVEERPVEVAPLFEAAEAIGQRPSLETATVEQAADRREPVTIQEAREAGPERMQAASDRATEPPLGRPGEPLPDRRDAAAQQAASDRLAEPTPKEPVKAIEAKTAEDVGRLAATVAAPVEQGPKGEKVVSFKRAGEGKMAITDESSKLASDAEAATLEAAVKAGTLPAEDLASLKAADEMIAHADTLEKAYAAAADCPALKGS